MWGPNCNRFDFHHGPWPSSGGDRENTQRCHGPPGHGHHDLPPAFPWRFPTHYNDHRGHHFRPHHQGHCHRPHGHPHHFHGHGHKHGHRDHGHHHACGKQFEQHRFGPWERRECRREFRRNWVWQGTEERRRGCQKKDETVLVRGIVIERRPHSV